MGHTANQDLSAQGKVALVTGANTGIGRVTAVQLALSGFHVFLACRDAAKTAEVLAEINERSNGQAKAEFLPLDLGDFESVRACANQFLARNLGLDLLINNAGLAGAKGLTRSGFELTFGVCHMGHFLLTQLLMPALQKPTQARVVVVASRAHRHARGIDFDSLRQATQGAGGIKEYAQAKLANILFVKALAHRLKGSSITTYALHPGVVATEVWRKLPGFIQPLIKLFMISPEDGAKTTLYCALSPDVQHHSGLYYSDCREGRHTAVAGDANLAEALWSYSERCVAEWQAGSASTSSLSA